MISRMRMSSLIRISMLSSSTLEVRFVRILGWNPRDIPSLKVQTPTLLQVCFTSLIIRNMADKTEIYPKGKARYEAAPTDIWALGLLLSMILTRSMPFTEGDRKYRFQLRSEVPDPAYEIIRACLRINPRERPTIDEIASHYWLSEQYIRDLARRR